MTIDTSEKAEKRKNSIWKVLFSFTSSDTTDESQASSVPYSKLFRYATRFEIIIALTGVFCAILMSMFLPLLNIIYGEYTSLLVDRAIGNGTVTTVYFLKLFGGGRKLTNPTQEEIEDAILEDAQAFGVSNMLLVIIMFILSAISVYFLNFTALRQIGKIRGKFFMAVLKQDMSWYDTHTNMNFASRIIEDLNKMKEGIGDKIAVFTNLIASSVFSIVTSFIYGWKLTLVVLTCSPLLMLSTALVSKIESSLTVKELDSYGSAGAVAEEVFSSIRTVAAFSGEQKELERYGQKLVPAIKQGQRKGFFSGIGNGTLSFILYCSNALAFWYGVELIVRDRGVQDPLYTPAVLVIVLFGVLTGAQNLGMTSPYLEAFSIARGSAATIFSIIDTEPKIDPFSKSGLKPENVVGNIELKDIHFHYPSRPGVEILKGLSLSIKAGETLALVGSSGCGKSTIIQLLQRFYDPIQGKIYLDGNEISSLNVKWLRSHIGVVGQEPVLFNTTVRTNISYGKLNATQEEIEFAAKQANCHEFIKKLPKGYDTHISNAQLSGGQKQRIAIARALIKEPRILLLDEATSALDLQSEAKVQKTLDQARVGRTTIIVAHRLSTIRNANRIVVINNGVVIEIGSHDELMNAKGHYYDLVATEAAAESKNTNQEQKLSKLKKLASFTESFQEGYNELSEDKEAKEETYDSPFIRIIKLNKPESLYIFIGVVASIVIGASFSAFAVLFGDVYRILSLEDAEKIRTNAKMIALLLVLAAFLTGVSAFLQSYAFNVAGVRLTARLRKMTFSSMIKQEIAWYDNPKNSVGALCSRLADDASSVQGATGTCVGAFVQSFSTLTLGFVVGFYYSWKMGLVCLAIMPLVFSSVYLEQKISLNFGIAEKKYIEDATKVAVEAISNIRTVASLCLEQTFYDNYMKEISNVNKALKSKTRLRGLVYAFGQSAPFLGYAIGLWYGGYLVAKEGLPYDYIIKVSEALIFGAWVTGQALAFAPNFNSAKLSAARIFKILDRSPEITSDPLSSVNDNLTCIGNVLYKDVNFHYPTRPEVQVLKEFNLEVNSGKTIALVGFSGCGKSTVIQLLQRFYDPDSGALMIDSYNIKNELSLPCLRKQLGIVSQEPVLFDRTIAENIAYGDNNRTIPISEIVEAAKQANIHNFITSLPLGYDTSLGTKGAQLSGGQKQRIAIARALVRQPRILLLDEATSALDRQSEKVVQEALDKAQEGRTCIVIAHRLITIKDADLICVMENGRIVETGTHTRLLTEGGLYYELYNLTSKDNN